MRRVGRPVRAAPTILCIATLLGAGQGHAADICEAVALRDVPALESSDSILKKGSIDDSITQFRVNKRTGETSFCSHGGFCYPTHVMVGGGKFQALKMTNCTVDAKGLEFVGEDYIMYGVSPVRSKIDPDRLRIDDVTNKLLNLGLCEACADSAARIYVEKPQSQCAALVKQSLEGNPDTLGQLQDGPDICR